MSGTYFHKQSNAARNKARELRRSPIRLIRPSSGYPVGECKRSFGIASMIGSCRSVKDRAPQGLLGLSNRTVLTVSNYTGILLKGKAIFCRTSQECCLRFHVTRPWEPVGITRRIFVVTNSFVLIVEKLRSIQTLVGLQRERLQSDSDSFSCAIGHDRRLRTSRQSVLP